jgi:hypothetical protein
MANHEVDARLCRWMLRARDLSGSDNLPFTEEFLAEMLGVRRTSVTTVAHTLQGAGMIKYSRGKIQILDVQGLQETACECYEPMKDNTGNCLVRAIVRRANWSSSPNGCLFDQANVRYEAHFVKPQQPDA